MSERIDPFAPSWTAPELPPTRTLPSPAFRSREPQRDVPRPRPPVPPSVGVLRSLTWTIVAAIVLIIAFVLVRALLEVKSQHSGEYRYNYGGWEEAPTDRYRWLVRLLGVGAAVLLYLNFLLVAVWIFHAKRNALRMCKQMPRLGPVASFVLLIVPVINILVLGAVMGDVWQHSTPERQGPHRLIRFITLYTLTALLVQLVNVFKLHSLPLAYMLMAGGAIVIVCQVAVMFAIERTQRATYKYLAARAIL